MQYPFGKTWWIDPPHILGGCYPGTTSPRESGRRLEALVALGVRVIINLQEPDERGRGGHTFPDYGPPLKSIAEQAGVAVDLHRVPIPDCKPPSMDQMHRILGILQAAVAGGRMAYVHCWGGHGRTGTVAACWLIWKGKTVEEALLIMRDARLHDPGCAAENAPQSDEQHAFLRAWAAR